MRRGLESANRYHRSGAGQAPKWGGVHFEIADGLIGVLDEADGAVAPV